MSTIFGNKFVSYLIHSKQFSFEKGLLQTIDKSLTDLRVSKAGRSDLYCRSPYSQIFKHVLDRLDTAQPEDGDLDGFPSFPNQPKRNWLDRWTGEPPGLIPQTRLQGADVHGHGRVGIGDGEGVRASPFRRPGDKPNVCNERRELDPERALGRSLPGRLDDLGHKPGIAAELHPPLLHVGAGDVELISPDPLVIFEDLDDLDVVVQGVPEDIGDHRRIEFSQCW